MEGPSCHWKGFQDLEPDGRLASRISKLILDADFSYLKEIALAIRKADSSVKEVNPTCSINTEKFSCGWNNVVFEAKFSDSVYWVARVWLPDEDADGEVVADMRSEITTIAVVKEKNKHSRTNGFRV